MAQVTSSPLRTVKYAGDRATALAALRNHPSWKVLIDEFNEKQETATNVLARQLLTGGQDAPAIDQRQIDYRRGFIAGAKAVLQSPENAINLLEREIEKEKAS